MNFDRTEEAQQLAASIARFVERDYGFEARRKIAGSTQGWSREAWKTFADLGLAGILVPAEYGGFGGGAVDAVPVMEAIGEALIVEPYVATVVGAQLIARGGTPAQKARILPAVVAGELTLAFAHTETDARYDLAHVATRATRRDGGFVVDGEKRVVVHGEHASMLIVSARTAGAVRSDDGISLFVVDRNVPGIAVHGYRTLDGMRAADVAFEGVHVTDDALVAQAGDALPLIETVTDLATALICAEAVGAIRCANDATLEYLKTRQQFGVPIGSFQAVQHRLADCYIDVEAMRWVTWRAAWRLAERRPASREVLVAKFWAADAGARVTAAAQHLHGGVGVDVDYPVHRYFLAAKALELALGGATQQLARLGRDIARTPPSAWQEQT